MAGIEAREGFVTQAASGRPAAVPGRFGRSAAGGDNPRMATTFEIHLNGERRTVPAGCDIPALLEREGLAGRRVAVEVNGEIVPRGAHAGHALREGDRIEIVHALGGG